MEFVVQLKSCKKRNKKRFGDLQDVHVIADDIIIAAKDEDEHDNMFVKVLEIEVKESNSRKKKFSTKSKK